MIRYEPGLVVVATYDYPSSENEDLSFSTGDKILVIEQVNNEWLKGQLNGKSGIFPISFVEKYGTQTTQAVFDFPAECAEDLGVKTGERLFVKSIVDENWACLVNSSGRKGNVPRNFLSPFQIEVANSLTSGSSFPSYEHQSSQWSYNGNVSGNQFGAESSNTKKNSSNPPGAVAGIDSFGLNNNLPQSSSSLFQPRTSLNPASSRVTSEKVASASSKATPMKAFEPQNGFNDFFTGELSHKDTLKGFTGSSSSNSGGMRRAVSQYLGPNDVTDGDDVDDDISEFSSGRNATAEKGFDDLSTSGSFSSSLTKSASSMDLRHASKAAIKSENQRTNAVNELIKTERIFSTDMDLFVEIFPASDWNALKINYRSVCGNIVQVQQFSKGLLVDLDRAKAGDEKFGALFLGKCDQLIRVFTEYCTNFENVPKTVEQYCLNKEISRFFDKGIQAMKKRGSKVLNMNSILLQPIQRVVKYPLLLGEISKHTSEMHPDKTNLLKSVAKLHEVVESINQTKRTREVVERYRSNEPSSFKGIFSKMSLGSLKKKSNRFSQNISNKLFNHVVDDFEFEKFRTDMKSLEKQLGTFQGSLSSYGRTVATFSSSMLGVVNEVKGLLLDKFSSEEMYKAHLTLCTRLKELSAKHVLAVENHVLKRVAKLIGMFTGPNNLVKKRDHKLLDYEKLLKDEVPESDDSLYTAKGNYTALNDQLKQELPQFNKLVQKNLADLAIYFLRLRSNFLTEFRTHFDKCSRSNKICTAASVSHINIRDIFEQKHIEVASKIASQVSFVPPSFASSPLPSETTDKQQKTASNGATASRKSKTSTSNRHSMFVNSNDTPGSESSSKQTESIKKKVRAKYAQRDLYTCKSLYKSDKPVHLNLEAGELVGVMQRKDPCGNANIWFVDNGDETGLVEALFLSPVFPTSPIEEHDPIVMRQKRAKATEGSVSTVRTRPKSMFESSGESEHSNSIAFDPFGSPDSKDQADMGLLAPVYLSPRNSRHNQVSSVTLSPKQYKKGATTTQNSTSKNSTANGSTSPKSPRLNQTTRKNASNRSSTLNLNQSAEKSNVGLNMFDPLSDNNNLIGQQPTSQHRNQATTHASNQMSSPKRDTQSIKQDFNQSSQHFISNSFQQNAFASSENSNSHNSQLSDLSVDSGFGGSPLTSINNRISQFNSAASSVNNGSMSADYLQQPVQVQNPPSLGRFKVCYYYCSATEVEKVNKPQNEHIAGKSSHVIQDFQIFFNKSVESLK